MPATPALTRRAVVRLGGATALGAVLVACTRGSDLTPGPTDPGGPLDPDRGLRAEIGAQEAALVRLYAAAVAALPGRQSSAAATIGARHDAYRQAIDPDGIATQSPSGSASPTGASSSPAAASPSPTPTLPTAPAAIAAVLRTAERGAATARLSQSLRAVDPELARIIVLAGAGAAGDRKSTRLNSSHPSISRMPSSA